jgi:hypothetical protein
VEAGSADLLTQQYRLDLVPVLIRLVFDCFTAFLNIFARAFHSVATGKCRSSAGLEKRREQRHNNSFNHDEPLLEKMYLRIGTRETDASSTPRSFYDAPISRVILCATAQCD